MPSEIGGFFVRKNMNREFGGGTPDQGKFNDTVKGLFDPSELHHFRGIDTGFNRYGDKVSSTFEAFQKQHLGRVHGVSLDGTPGQDKGDNYFGVMHALPLEDSGQAGHVERILLVFPDQDKVMYAEAEPLASGSLDDRTREVENDILAGVFDTLYAPAETPYLHADWPVELGQTPFDVVYSHQEQFGIEITKQYDDDTDPEVLQKALDAARSVRLRQLPTDDVELVRSLGEDAALDLEVFSAEFSREWERLDPDFESGTGSE